MPGKLQPDILKQSVLNFTGALRKDLLVGGGLGEDAALIRVPDGILVAASDPVTGASRGAGSLLVHINANDLACKGADPSWLVVTLIVPDAMGVKFIHDIMQEIHDTCKTLNIAIAGGHTELTDRYEQPVISGTMLGITQYELTAKAIREGDVILLTGHAGLEGMSIIAHDRPEIFSGMFGEQELEEIRSWQSELSVLKPARILREYSRYMHDPTEGGLNGALYETARACGLGIKFYDDALPVSPLTLRASEALSFNPYNLISSGMLIAVISPEKVHEAQKKLQTNGIMSSIAGEFTHTSTLNIDSHEELWGILARRII